MKKKGKRGVAGDEHRRARRPLTRWGLGEPRPEPPREPVDRWQSVLLASTVALLVARPLVPEDPGGQNGYGAPTNVLWLVLACGWFLGQLRRGDFRLRFGWVDSLVLALV